MGMKVVCAEVLQNLQLAVLLVRDAGYDNLDGHLSLGATVKNKQGRWPSPKERSQVVLR